MYLDVLSKMPLIPKVILFVLLYDLISLVASVLATKWYIQVVDDTLCVSHLKLVPYWPDPNVKMIIVVRASWLLHNHT
jgi:hypothetical protein